MSDAGLVEQLVTGELDAEQFIERVEREAAEAAKAARQEAREETRERGARRERRRTRERPAGLSPEAERELELSRARIKKTADKARYI